MKITFAGDFVVNKPVIAGKEVIDFFKESDYNIVNFEAPITESEVKIVKTGPHLKGKKTESLSLIKKLGINLLTLANNHINDYGSQGVGDTISFCEENNIHHVGAGCNIEEAAKIYCIKSKGCTIGIINIAENEWSSASKNSAGANGMDLINNTKSIIEASNSYDFVIVVVHGGHEYYNLPSPRMQKQYRYYADMGADLVVGHHTHCISGYELYNGKPIYYGLGNFIFTKSKDYDGWYEGLLLRVEFENDKLSTSLKGIKQNKKDFGLSLIEGEESTQFFNRVKDFNKIIENEDMLGKAWEDYTEQEMLTYLNYWSLRSFINSRYISWLLRKFNVKLFNQKSLVLFLNLMRCEAHYDLSKESIKRFILKNRN